MSNLTMETSRLILRPFVDGDAAALSRCSSQPPAERFLADMVWHTEDEAREWINWFNTEKFNPAAPHAVLAVVLKEEQRLIGFAGVGPKRELGNETELGYLIAAEYQNRGYATEAARAMVWWAFEQAGQDALCVIVMPENGASRRVAEKLGFIYGGTRTLRYEDGSQRVSDYFRLYHLDWLPGPEWTTGSQYPLEAMGDFFDRRAGGYDGTRLSDAKAMEQFAHLGDAIPKTREPLRILDIGCGTGMELDYIWASAPNAHITGVDLSREMLALLLKNHAEHRGQITPVVASYLDWPYPAEAFDIALSSQTMHHLRPEQKLAVYRELRGTLKPGGFYLENDFIVDAVMAEQYRRRYDSIMSRAPADAVAGQYHVDIPCTLDAQLKLLSGAGFRSVEVLRSRIRASWSGALIRAKV